MTIRMRKLIGTFTITIYLSLYCLILMAFGGHYVVGAGPWIELGFYIITGFGWLPVAAIIIKWMSRRTDPRT